MWIEFDGMVNVRDLGGIPAADGRKVRPGRLLRGAGLDKASDADLARLQNEYQLRHVIDLRDPRERTEHPDRAVPGAEIHALQVLPELPRKSPMNVVPDFDGLFRQIYHNMATRPETANAYRAMFDVLLNCPEGAVYFHCTQGKDRTGIAAILILTALGADEETAKADYFLSNAGLKDAMAEPGSMGVRPWPKETIEKLFNVFPEILGVYLDAVKRDWCGLDGYLRGPLGLTDAEIARLRELYLE